MTSLHSRAYSIDHGRNHPGHFDELDAFNPVTIQEEWRLEAQAVQEAKQKGLFRKLPFRKADGIPKFVEFQIEPEEEKISSAETVVTAATAGSSNSSLHSHHNDDCVDGRRGARSPAYSVQSEIIQTSRDYSLSPRRECYREDDRCRQPRLGLVSNFTPQQQFVESPHCGRPRGQSMDYNASYHNGPGALVHGDRQRRQAQYIDVTQPSSQRSQRRLSTGNPSYSQHEMAGERLKAPVSTPQRPQRRLSSGQQHAISPVPSAVMAGRSPKPRGGQGAHPCSSPMPYGEEGYINGLFVDPRNVRDARMAGLPRPPLEKAASYRLQKEKRVTKDGQYMDSLFGQTSHSTLDLSRSAHY